MELKKGDRVIVSASVFGDGVAHPGVVEEISTFFYTTYVYIHFNDVNFLGIDGVTLTNLALIEKI